MNITCYGHITDRVRNVVVKEGRVTGEFRCQRAVPRMGIPEAWRMFNVKLQEKNSFFIGSGSAKTRFYITG